MTVVRVDICFLLGPLRAHVHKHLLAIARVALFQRVINAVRLAALGQVVGTGAAGAATGIPLSPRSARIAPAVTAATFSMCAFLFEIRAVVK